MHLRRFTDLSALRSPSGLADLLQVTTPIWVLPVAPLLLAVVAGCTGVGNRAYIIDAGEAAQAPTRPPASAPVGGGQQPSWILDAVHGDGPGDLMLASRPVSQTVTNLPKSRQGNPDEYTVFGQRYRVLDSAAGFQEQGQASWYGRKFHGRSTSSGEAYDMHELTAAHKHLPIPTFVQVTNLDNGREVVVKVNDRGPFVDDRIIDLSFAAAQQLDMTKSGTANVSIEALSVHVEEASANVPAVADTASVASAEPVATESAPSEPSAAEPEPTELASAEPEPEAVRADEATALSGGKTETVDEPAGGKRRYIQVGAFHDDDNARSLLDRLTDRLTSPARVAREPSVHQPGSDIFRVHIGPFDNDQQVLDTLTTLAGMGLEGYETQRLR